MQVPNTFFTVSSFSESESISAVDRRWENAQVILHGLALKSMYLPLQRSARVQIEVFGDKGISACIRFPVELISASG